MIQKILLTASLGGLLLIGAPGILQGHNQQGQQSQQQASKTISGKVTGIGDQGHSFTVDTEGNGGNQSMQFVVDKNTRVQGQVKVGTMVTVDYQPMNGGQLLCLRVAAQNS
ncbi:MAG TPA: DUF5666 domain-containing protein [Candidatus Eremiobacteraceae bacterium]|nr:DUF5666 domain-containing protein [Candidatus Eremiobacteraceae bacterium]